MTIPIRPTLSSFVFLVSLLSDVLTTLFTRLILLVLLAYLMEELTKSTSPVQLRYLHKSPRFTFPIIS
jgi:hypothetical protein